MAACASALGVYGSEFAARVAASSAVYFVQDLVLLWLLLSGARQTVGHGQHLIVVDVSINLLIMVHRAWIASSDEQFVAHVADSCTSHTLVYLWVFVSLNLIAISFVLTTIVLDMDRVFSVDEVSVVTRLC